MNVASAASAWNGSRWSQCDGDGFYESWFVRANHPTRALAFWIRYTLFSPLGTHQPAIGESWVIAFDGETQTLSAARRPVAMEACSFARHGLDVRVGSSTLTDDEATGDLLCEAHAFRWRLQLIGDDPPLLLLPPALYAGDFPKAKSVVPRPNLRFHGSFECDGKLWEIDGWPGSQNHNYGSRHTDDYAWGQVAGFDTAPDAFLECATARLRVGPHWGRVWTPPLTVVVLRLDGREYALNGIYRALSTRTRREGLAWEFDAVQRDVRIHARFHAPASAFAALRYANPPGGYKRCLNSKLASCTLHWSKKGEPSRTLQSSRAAYELLSDDDGTFPPSC